MFATSWSAPSTAPRACCPTRTSPVSRSQDRTSTSAASSSTALGRFEAMMAIEEVLGIEIDDDEIGAIGRLDELVAYIQSRAG
jgi:hypothetical protein